MHRKFRFSLVSALILFAVACAEPLATGPGAAPPQRPVFEDDDPWAMVPAEADVILWADMAKLRASPWTRESFATVLSDEQAAQNPGLAQMRRLDRLIFAKVPALKDDANLLIGQGDFDREHMRLAFADKGGSVQSSTYRSAELHVRGDEALAFTGRRTVLSGMTVAVRAALDCQMGVARSADSESWLVRLRAELARDKGSAVPVAALYMRLGPAARETLMKEMGEGGQLEEVAARADLDADLTANAVGVTRTPQEARDLADRLADRIREARGRPIVAAFGFGSVLDSVRFSVEENRVKASMRVSQQERTSIAVRMTIVAEMLAKMRKERSERREQP
jgi:hypothetical protein